MNLVNINTQFRILLIILSFYATKIYCNYSFKIFPLFGLEEQGVLYGTKYASFSYITSHYKA